MSTYCLENSDSECILMALKNYENNVIKFFYQTYTQVTELFCYGFNYTRLCAYVDISWYFIRIEDNVFVVPNPVLSVLISLIFC